MTSAPLPHPPATCPASGPHIGVFDSGVGGLSVLRALRAALPGARLTYVADSAHAPYGDRDVAHVQRRSHLITQHLAAFGAQLIVVACNTATALAIESLRREWPALPIVGVEPGVKPAVALSTVRRVGVLATPATVASERFQRLVAAHSAQCEVIAVPCPGLAARIERRHLDDPALAATIDGLCSELRERKVDVVALGCTHYPFVRMQIEAALPPGLAIVDTAEAVARQAATLCQRLSASAPAEALSTPRIELQTNADVHRLAALAADWLGFEVPVRACDPALS